MLNAGAPWSCAALLRAREEGGGGLEQAKVFINRNVMARNVGRNLKTEEEKAAAQDCISKAIAEYWVRHASQWAVALVRE